MSHVHISRNKLDDNLTIRELEMDVHTRNPDVGVVLQQLALQPNVGRGCKNGEGQDLAELGPVPTTWYEEP
jgi:hypothetical protein